MDQVRHPLTKRPRAAIACSSCRQNKVKCDSQTPACERCTRLGLDCAYLEGGRDKRLERQAERKANIELRSKVKELEAQLVAATQQVSPQANNNTQNLEEDRANAFETTPNGPEVENNVLQPTNSAFSDASSRRSARPPSNPDSPVDVLAAGVFDHPLAGYIYYFGATSNHALFWSLTASIANLGHRSSLLYKEPLESRASEGRAQLFQAAFQPPFGDGGASPGEVSGPTREIAVTLISRFFDTIGAVLPYISERTLLESLNEVQSSVENKQASVRTRQALLNIVYAHSLSTQNPSSADPFYRRTLNLLDLKTLYIPSLELLQTLLLLSIYQQNHQRSTESWTTHSLAVKTAHQLGIHAPSLYEFLSVHEKELRSRLWLAVVNQDRMLSTTLGQPSLVPVQHIRMDIAEMLVTVPQSRTAEVSSSKRNLSYFRNIISLHEIMGIALDSIYDSNVSTSNHASLHNLTSNTLNLSLRLEQWRESKLEFGLIGSDLPLSSWSASTLAAERHSVLVSIFYYRTVLLVHGSLLMSALELATNGSQEISSTLVQDAIRSLMKKDFLVVQQFHHLIRGLLSYHRPFFAANAIWWTCNYGALTLSLHAFGFWVASMNMQTHFLAPGLDSAALEANLRDCLNTLKGIGVSSVMSMKAHRCLTRHFEFLKSISSREEGPTNHPIKDTTSSTSFPHAEPRFQDGILPMPDPAEMFGDLNVQDFMFPGSVDLDFGISDFDAAGMI